MSRITIRNASADVRGLRDLDADDLEATLRDFAERLSDASLGNNGGPASGDEVFGALVWAITDAVEEALKKRLEIIKASAKV